MGGLRWGRGSCFRVGDGGVGKGIVGGGGGKVVRRVIRGKFGSNVHPNLFFYPQDRFAAVQFDSMRSGVLPNPHQRRLVTGRKTPIS